MSLNIAGPIRTAILGNATITALLGGYSGEPSVFTRRPAPKGATYPMIMIGPMAGAGSEDFLNRRNPIVSRDIIAYGEVSEPGLAADEVRDVDSIAEELWSMFHRRKAALTVAGFDVRDITVRGPFAAPADDDRHRGVGISITVRLAEQ